MIDCHIESSEDKHSYIFMFYGYGKASFFRLCPLDIFRSAFIKTICLVLAKCRKFL